jgi:hypothetical protein
MSAHGVTVELPRGWDARASKKDGIVTLHLANYAIPSRDGEFGPRATRTMPTGGVFIALTEYRPQLANKGLYRARRAPRRLAPGDFSPNAVLNARRHQLGHQRFFSAKGHPFCLYAVIRASRNTARVVAEANTVLRELRIEGRKRAD